MECFTPELLISLVIFPGSVFTVGQPSTQMQQESQVARLGGGCFGVNIVPLVVVSDSVSSGQ